jgi:hypothetical protein
MSLMTCNDNLLVDYHLLVINIQYPVDKYAITSLYDKYSIIKVNDIGSMNVIFSAFHFLWKLKKIESLFFYNFVINTWI